MAGGFAGSTGGVVKKREPGEEPTGYCVYIVVAFATIGAILFGFDQGNWAGAIEKEGFRNAFCGGVYHGNSTACADAELHPAAYTFFLSLGSSLVQFGAFVGAVFVAPFVAGTYGRREAMFAGSVVTIIGVIPMMTTTVVSLFWGARFLTGLGVGLVTYALPMFISEVAPAEIRGMLGSSFQLVMVFGMLIASILNAFPIFSYQMSFGLPLVPSAILAVGIFCFPMSPRFALMKWMRKGDEARGDSDAMKSLTMLRGNKKAAAAELEDLKQSMKDTTKEAPFSTLWLDRSIRKRVLIANGLQWMQQFSGINALLSFGVSMMAKVDLPINPFQAQIVITMFNIIATVAMMSVIDKFGRRPLLLASAALMCVFMTASAAIAYVSEELNMKEGTGIPLLCCLCGYIASFGIGWGGVCWVYPSEIFPMDVKGRAMSTSVGSQWLANFLIAFLVPLQVDLLHLWGTFVFYSVALLIIFLIVYMYVPETKGVPMEDMDMLFGKRDIKGMSDDSVACDNDVP